MRGWRHEAFDNVIADESGGNLKTPQSEFLPSGRYAIVDQGKELVAGYTNDESRLCHAQLPVIVFGDHTRCFKYIDFPFCMGADGVKVLRPKVEADAKYLYHYLRQVRLTEGGYDRHFKYLKRISIPLPPLPEQRLIAEILDKADALRAKRRAALAQLDTLTQSIFLDMFGDPATNPKGWPVSHLQEVVREGTIVTYGIVQAGDEFPGGVPYIRTGDIVDGRIASDRLRHTDPMLAAKFARSRVHAGEIVMSIRATVGTTALVPSELEGANLTQGTARIAPGQHVEGDYLLHLLRAPGTQHWINLQIKGVTFHEITLARLRELPVMVPPIDVQRLFAQRVAAVRRLNASQRSAVSQQNGLFVALQHRAFRGEL